MKWSVSQDQLIDKSTISILAFSLLDMNMMMIMTIILNASDTINKFNNALDKHWQNEDILLYNYKAKRYYQPRRTANR